MAVRRVSDDTADFSINNSYNRNREAICDLIKSSDLTYDGKRVRWTNSFEALMNFVEKVIEERGKWSSKVSSSRKFTSSVSDLQQTENFALPR